MKSYVVVEHLPDNKVQLHLINASTEEVARLVFEKDHPNKKILTVAEFTEAMVEVR